MKKKIRLKVGDFLTVDNITYVLVNGYRKCEDCQVAHLCNDDIITDEMFDCVKTHLEKVKNE